MTNPEPQSQELENIPESVIKLHDNRELMRLASLVGTDAKIPELKLARYIDQLIQTQADRQMPQKMSAPAFGKDTEADLSAGFRKGWNSCIEEIKSKMKGNQ